VLVCELGEAGCREAHATPPSGRVRPGACQQAVSPSGTGPGLAGLDTGMQALLWQANGEQQQRTACQESAQARCGAAALHTQAEVKQQSCPTVWRGAAKPRGVGAAGFFEVKKISPPAESLGTSCQATRITATRSACGARCDVCTLQRSLAYAREHAHIDLQGFAVQRIAPVHSARIGALRALHGRDARA